MSKRTFYILLFLVILVNFTGLLCDIFAQDSSMYAVISKSFSTSGNYFDIYLYGTDWLDKPHFPFWVCGLFIDVFGANTLSYKLPSLIFFIVGIVYTFKLAQTLYNKEVGYLSVLILGSSLHIFLSNNDIRVEAILLGLIMGTLYYLHKLTSVFSIKNLILTSIFSAAAIMTKGTFVLIIPYSAIFLNLIVQRKYKNLFNARWIAALLLTFIFITPEIYAVYHQFDLFPEKVVFGQKNVSGVKFFLWDGQFSRFINTGPIKGHGDPFFFIHTMFWAFAPWAIVAISSVVITIRKLIKKEPIKEYITFFGFLIMFILFSASGFQLPHYTNIIFPLLSIMVAVLILKNKNLLISKIIKLSINFYSIAFAAVIILIEYFFKTERMIIALIILLILSILIVFTNSKKALYSNKFIILGILSSMAFFLYLNLCFYPKLLSYQSGSQIAYHINKNYPKEDIMVCYNDWLLQYYIKNQLFRIETLDELKNETLDENKILVANDSFLNQLKESGLNFNILETFKGFHITRLNKDFIYHKTRNKSISYFYVIKVKTVPKSDVLTLN